jgi:hypothetical protein
MLVICNKVGVSKFCKTNCLHGKQHEPYILELQQKKCTTWDDCTPIDMETIKVRCIKCKE